MNYLLARSKYGWLTPRLIGLATGARRKDRKQLAIDDVAHFRWQIQEAEALSMLPWTSVDLTKLIGEILLRHALLRLRHLLASALLVEFLELGILAAAVEAQTARHPGRDFAMMAMR